MPCSSRSDELFLTPRDTKECTTASDARGEYEPSLQVSSMSRSSNWFVKKHLGLSGACFSFLKRASKVEQEEEDMQVSVAAQEQHKVQRAFLKPLQVGQGSSSKDDQPCGKSCKSLSPASEKVCLSCCPGPLVQGRFAKMVDAELLTSSVRTSAVTSAALADFAAPRTKRCCRLCQPKPSLV